MAHLDVPGLSAAEVGAIEGAVAGSTLLSGLAPDEIQQLLAPAEHVTLEPGEHLFRQGDASDSAYLVTSGVLSAVLDGESGQSQSVGSVRAGESVGEMGVLTGAPRSLSVVARTRATLLRVDGRGFQAVCLNHPALLLKLVHVISARNRETIRALSPFGQGRTIAILPWHDSDMVRDFLRRLQERIRRSGHFDFADAEQATSAGPAAGTGDRLRVLEAGVIRSAWSDYCVETADRVLFVADASRPDVVPTEPARRVLDAAGPGEAIETDLVLVRAAGPRTTAGWLDRARVMRHHHVRAGNDDDEVRLLRHVRGHAVAVVLSGGGLRGWLHLGALRALEARRIPIDAIGGSSIGAIVAACRLQQPTIDEAIRSFGRIARAIGQSKGVGSLTYPAVSILNGRKWTDALRGEFGDSDIENFARLYFAVSCNLSRNEQVVHRSGRVWEALRASSALPAILPPLVRNGQLFVDGGIVNNAPVDVARAMMGGACRTVAVELSGTGESDPRSYRFPPVLSFTDALMAKLRLRHREFRFISIGELVFRSLTHGSMAKTNENLRAADVVLRPAFPNQGFLSAVDPERLVDMGDQSMQARLEAAGVFT